MCHRNFLWFKIKKPIFFSNFLWITQNSYIFLNCFVLNGTSGFSVVEVSNVLLLYLILYSFSLLPRNCGVRAAGGQRHTHEAAVSNTAGRERHRHPDSPPTGGLSSKFALLWVILRLRLLKCVYKEASLNSSSFFIPSSQKGVVFDFCWCYFLDSPPHIHTICSEKLFFFASSTAKVLPGGGCKKQCYQKYVAHGQVYRRRPKVSDLLDSALPLGVPV